MPHDSRSLRPLLIGLSRDLRLLVAEIVGLARAEFAEALRSALLYVGVAAAAIVVALGGLLVLVSALVLIVIALGLSPWVAATLVGLLMVGAGGGTAYFCAMKLRHVAFDLPRTRHSVRDTLSWLNAQCRQ
jgi:hypothetical protein